MTSGQDPSSPVGVAEAKRRFSELLDRVGAGEHVVVERRGRPAVVLVPATPDALDHRTGAPLGLAAVAGALGDWDDLETVVEDLYRARRQSSDRPAPTLE